MSEDGDNSLNSSRGDETRRFSSNSVAKILEEATSEGKSEIDAMDESSDKLDANARSRATELFERKCDEASQIVEDDETVNELLAATNNWTQRFSNKLNDEFLSSLTTVFRLVSASVSGRYQGLASSTLVCLVGALLYCVSPIDVVPDAIPFVGLLDDAFVLSLVVKNAANELRTFRAWERLQTANLTLCSYLPYFQDVKRVVVVPGWLTENDDCSAEIDVLTPVFPNAVFDLFAWRSNVSWEDARNYADGEGVDHALDFLQRSGDMGETAIVGHSLGARLTARALARLAKEPEKKSFWSRKPSNRPAQTFLFGAAVDSDDPDLEYAPRGVQAPLCNFFSRSDRVLSYLYRLVEQKTPLGLSGLAREEENFVDCAVSGHEEYWLGVTENVASLLNFIKSGVMLQSLSLADGATRGLREYLGHQFLAYAKFFRESVLNDREPTNDSES